RVLADSGIADGLCQRKAERSYAEPYAYSKWMRPDCDARQYELCFANRRYHAAAVLSRKLLNSEPAIAGGQRHRGRTSPRSGHGRVLQNKLRLHQLPLHGGAVHVASDAWLQRPNHLYVVQDLGRLCRRQCESSESQHRLLTAIQLANA